MKVGIAQKERIIRKRRNLVTTRLNFMAWILQASQLFLIDQNKVVNVAMGLRSIPVHEMGRFKLKQS